MDVRVSSIDSFQKRAAVFVRLQVLSWCDFAAALRSWIAHLHGEDKTVILVHYHLALDSGSVLLPCSAKQRKSIK